MIYEYRFIKFFAAKVLDDDNYYQVRNKKHNILIGRVIWYAAWRKWVLEPENGTVFSADCLQDISHFIGQLKDRP